jgi:hypothetical protein
VTLAIRTRRLIGPGILVVSPDSSFSVTRVCPSGSEWLAAHWTVEESVQVLVRSFGRFCTSGNQPPLGALWTYIRVRDAQGLEVMAMKTFDFSCLGRFQDFDTGVNSQVRMAR